MQYIKFTDLRTRSKSLAKALENGEEINLVRRSILVGKVVPYSASKTKTISSKRLESKIEKPNLPRLTVEEIDRRYRKAMLKKHGKGLSRH